MDFDSSTHPKKSYLDVRLRLFYNGHSWSFHLISLLMFHRHTDKNMMNLTKIFHALYPAWKHLKVGVSTDGYRSMTGRIRGVLTRIMNVLPPGASLVWCGLHKLDLGMQNVYKNHLTKHFCVCWQIDRLLETTAENDCSHANRTPYVLCCSLAFYGQSSRIACSPPCGIPGVFATEEK